MNENLKEKYESVCKENIRLRAELEAEKIAFKKVVVEVHELEKMVEKIQREKDKLAQQLIDGNDTVYIENCDNLTFNF